MLGLHAAGVHGRTAFLPGNCDRSLALSGLSPCLALSRLIDGRPSMVLRRVRRAARCTLLGCMRRDGVRSVLRSAGSAGSWSNALPPGSAVGSGLVGPGWAPSPTLLGVAPFTRVSISAGSARPHGALQRSQPPASARRRPATGGSGGHGAAGSMADRPESDRAAPWAEFGAWAATPPAGRYGAGKPAPGQRLLATCVSKTRPQALI